MSSYLPPMVCLQATNSRKHWLRSRRGTPFTWIRLDTDLYETLNVTCPFRNRIEVVAYLSGAWSSPPSEASRLFLISRRPKLANFTRSRMGQHAFHLRHTGGVRSDESTAL